MVAMIGVSVSASDLPRSALRHVVQACAMAKRTFSVSAPCLRVDLGDADRPGTVTIRANYSATHIIVAPIEPIDGIEDPRALRREAGAYWRIALAARSLVSEAAGAGVPISAIGLAVNSKGSRSQDHLHIHAECLQPFVLATLRAQPAQGEGWYRIPHLPGYENASARRMSAAAIADGNIFALLATVPGGGPDSGDLSAVLIDAAEAGEYVLAAARSTQHTAEGLFDWSCTNQRGR